MLKSDYLNESSFSAVNINFLKCIFIKNDQID